jgi:hypothetical protein
MSKRRQYGEKEEKQEKQQEKEEKSWEEKWRRDPLNAAAWAIILIWLGVALLAGNFDLFGDMGIEVWHLFFLGAGGILLLEVIARLLLPAFRQPVIGTLLLAALFLAIGFGGLADSLDWGVGPELIWALALIVVGCYVLFRGLSRPRE